MTREKVLNEQFEHLMQQYRGSRQNLTGLEVRCGKGALILKLGQCMRVCATESAQSSTVYLPTLADVGTRVSACAHVLCLYCDCFAQVRLCMLAQHVSCACLLNMSMACHGPMALVPLNTMHTPVYSHPCMSHPQQTPPSCPHSLLSLLRAVHSAEAHRWRGGQASRDTTHWRASRGDPSKHG